MKEISLFTIKTLSLLCMLVFSLQAQVTNTSSSGRNNTKIQDARQVELQVQQIIEKSENYFKDGELALKDGVLTQARFHFDRSIKAILYSGINIKKVSKLGDYYFQLVDRIYKREIGYKKLPTQLEKLNFAISPKCGGKTENIRELGKKTKQLLIAVGEFYKQGDDGKATIFLRQLLINEPRSAEAYLLLGKIHLRNGDIEQAISSLKTALFWNSHLIEANILLGNIYFEKEDVFQAANYSRSALNIDSDNKRAQALSRQVEGSASNEDKKIIKDDSIAIENLIKESKEKIDDNKNKYVDVVFVAPFQSVTSADALGEDFAHVLSEVLVDQNLCVVRNEDRERIFEDSGFDTNETLTLATAIKFALLSKSNLLIVGNYERTFDSINTNVKIIRVDEGQFLSEKFPNGKEVIRNIILNDSPSNLRTLQGQIAYQILYQRDKAIPYSQNQFIETTSKIKIPASLNIDGNSTEKPDFSTNNLLRRTICDENILRDLQIRNFRLGLTFSEAIKTLPKATAKNINSYEKQMFQNFSIAALKDERFKDINSIQLQFFDNRLYSVEVIYDGNIKWQNLDEFASQVEKSLSLPTMKNGGYEFDGKYLYCGNYQIKVMLANYKIPAIHLFDTTVFDKIIQRRQEEKNKILQQKIEEEKRKRQVEEEKKKVFKP